MDRYKSYKNSGEKWLGEIPSHWGMLPIKYILRERKEIVGKNSNQYQLLSLTLKGIIERDMENPEGKFPASFDSYQKVYKGDFVFCNFDNEETPRAVGLSKFNGMITGAYDVLYKKNCDLDSDFLNYYFLYIDDGKRFKPLYKGLRKTVPYDAFMSYKLPIPPLTEQRAIALYLDAATAKIDAAIAREQKMIDLLTERKQIIINQAVTKGLIPNVKLKDSGTEWIGEIPESWEILPLKSICHLGKGLQITKADLVEEGLPVVSYGQIHAKYNSRTHLSKDLIRHVPASFAKGNESCIVRPNEFIVADTSEDLEGCGNMVFNDSDQQIYAGYHTIIIRQLKYDFPKYLAYLFTSQTWRKQIRSLVNSVKVYSITQSILKRTEILQPSVDEQRAIVAYLDKKTKVIDAAIKQRTNMIALLQERKQILINDVVTGKVRVS